MKTGNQKSLGIALVSAAIALFGWIAYEPASIMAALRITDVVSEAVVVVAASAVSGFTLAGGCALLFVRTEISAVTKKA